jgi:ABC-type uncharacterized transport system substrate-binding protein
VVVGCGAQRMKLLRELVPTAKTIALLVNPDNLPGTADTANVAAAARAFGLQLGHLDVRNDREIESAVAALARERSDILYFSPDPLFFNERSRLVAVTARNALPAIYASPRSLSGGAAGIHLRPDAAIALSRIGEPDRRTALVWTMSAPGGRRHAGAEREVGV